VQENKKSFFFFFFFFVQQFTWGRETDEINNNQKRFEIQLRNENIKEKQNKETIETLTIQLPTEKL
jgi:hypothetical protein